jgi:glucose/arabinose dehydrogenase
MKSIICVTILAAIQAMAANPTNVVITPGYAMTAVATGLNFPTAITLQDDSIWVAEGGIIGNAAVKKIGRDGHVRIVIQATDLPSGVLVSPLTGITFAEGRIWLSHLQSVNGSGKVVPLGTAGAVTVGAISSFKPNDPVSSFQTVVSGLPSFGDHPAPSVVFKGDRMYFATGLPTNSSVVGPDNGWATSFPTFHDFPPVDISLSGIGYLNPAPFLGHPTASVITEPFMPFGSGAVKTDTKVPAATPSNPGNGIIIAGGGAVYSISIHGKDHNSDMRLEAWGFRNDYGLAFDPFNDDLLFVSNNGADNRGSRPIVNDWDDMFIVHPGKTVEFFGWPDYFHDPKSRQPRPVTESFFCPPGDNTSASLPPCPQFAFSENFRHNLDVQPAFAELENHSSANMFDFSTDSDFGFKGDIFIAETGSIPPGTGATSLVGYKIVRIDRATGLVTDFITHPDQNQDTIFPTSPSNCPATSFNKPIDVKLKDSKMFIADMGCFFPAPTTPGTGKVWMVSPAR